MTLNKGRKVVSRFKSGIYTYQHEMICCGKSRCLKCAKGLFHGPYWYKYFYKKIQDPKDPNKTVVKKFQKYVGKILKVPKEGEEDAEELRSACKR